MSCTHGISVQVILYVTINATKLHKFHEFQFNKE